MKKAPNGDEAKRILGRVPDQVSFWLCTNQKLYTLKDLSNSLEKISDEVFRYHVNKDKNDFENWIRDIVQDRELAREISRIKTKETLTRKIVDRVNDLVNLSKKSTKSNPRVKKAKKSKKVSRR